MFVPAVRIALGTTPDEGLRSLAVYGSTRAQAKDVLDKFAFPALGYIFLKVISLVRPSVSLSLD